VIGVLWFVLGVLAVSLCWSMKTCISFWC